MSSALRIAMEIGLRDKENLCFIINESMSALYSTSETPCTREYMLVKQCMKMNPVYLQTTVCMPDYLRYILCMQKHT